MHSRTQSTDEQRGCQFCEKFHKVVKESKNRLYNFFVRRFDIYVNDFPEVESGNVIKEFDIVEVTGNDTVIISSRKKVEGLLYEQGYNLGEPIGICENAEIRELTTSSELESTTEKNVVCRIGVSGNLMDMILTKRRLSEREAKRVFKNLVLVVKTYHDCDIYHGDLKCENIFFGSDMGIMLDSGFSKLSVKTGTGQNQLNKSYRGSFAYAAPEILSGLPFSPRTADMWSLGVILYTIVYGFKPFGDSLNKEDLLTQIEKKLTFPSFLTVSVSPSCQTLIRHLLEPDVYRRATMLEVLYSRWLNFDLVAGEYSDDVVFLLQ